MGAFIEGILTSDWRTFWPGLASTVLGVVIGIPVALFVNRRIDALSEARKHKQEQRRLALALQAVRGALKANHGRLAFLIENLEQKAIAYGVPFDTGLDTATWDAVKAEVIPYLRNPKLQSDLAYYFSRLNLLSSFNELYYNYSFGTLSTLPNAAQRGEGVGLTFLSNARSAQDRALELLSALNLELLSALTAHPGASVILRIKATDGYRTAKGEVVSSAFQQLSALRYDLSEVVVSGLIATIQGMVATPEDFIGDAAVNRYHQILRSLEEAGNAVAEFRVPADRLFQDARLHELYQHSDKFVARDTFLSQLDSILLSFDVRIPANHAWPSLAFEQDRQIPDRSAGSS